MQQFNETYKKLLEDYTIDEGLFSAIGSNISNIATKSLKSVGKTLKDAVVEPFKSDKYNPFAKAYSETSDIDSVILKKIIKEIKDEYKNNQSFGLRNKTVIINGTKVSLYDLISNIKNFKMGKESNITEALKVISQINLNDVIANINKQDKQQILSIIRNVLSNSKKQDDKKTVSKKTNSKSLK